MSLFQRVNNDLATIAISAMCGVFRESKLNCVKRKNV